MKMIQRGRERETTTGSRCDSPAESEGPWKGSPSFGRLFGGPSTRWSAMAVLRWRMLSFLRITSHESPLPIASSGAVSARIADRAQRTRVTRHVVVAAAALCRATAGIHTHWLAARLFFARSLTHSRSFTRPLGRTLDLAAHH